MKTVLVTGGTGFIGSAIVKKLLNSNYKVKVLDNNWRGSRAKLGEYVQHKNLEMVEGDIREKKDVLMAATDVQQFIHLAYINGTEHFYSKPDLVLDVAVRGMLNSIDACIELNIKDFVLASSSEVYQSPPSVPTDESAPLVIPDITNPRYSYGGGKILCELFAMNYGRKFFDRMTIFRPHNVYGPDMGHEHVIPQFVKKAVELTNSHGNDVIDFPILGTGDQSRSFIYIDDFTDGLYRVISEGKHLEIYHIGTMEEVKIRDVVGLVMNEFNRDFQLIASSGHKGSTQRRCPEISKIMQLGFKPQTSLKDGIKKTVSWYRDFYSK